MGKHGKITQIYCKVTIAKVSVNGLSLLRRYSAPGPVLIMLETSLRGSHNAEFHHKSAIVIPTVRSCCETLTTLFHRAQTLRE